MHFWREDMAAPWHRPTIRHPITSDPKLTWPASCYDSPLCCSELILNSFVSYRSKAPRRRHVGKHQLYCVDVRYLISTCYLAHLLLRSYFQFPISIITITLTINLHCSVSRFLDQVFKTKLCPHLNVFHALLLWSVSSSCPWDCFSQQAVVLSDQAPKQTIGAFFPSQFY